MLELDHTAEIYAASALLWRPPTGSRHRKPFNRRSALRVALWAMLALLLALAVASVHRYGYGHALNGGFFWHTPFTPARWSFGYETFGTPGWFSPAE